MATLERKTLLIALLALIVGLLVGFAAGKLYGGGEIPGVKTPTPFKIIGFVGRDYVSGCNPQSTSQRYSQVTVTVDGPYGGTVQPTTAVATTNASGGYSVGPFTEEGTYYVTVTRGGADGVPLTVSAWCDDDDPDAPLGFPYTPDFGEVITDNSKPPPMPPAGYYEARLDFGYVR